MRAALLVLLLITSCADARDLFRPYDPQALEIQAMLKKPMPSPSVDVGIVLGCPADPDGKPSLCEMCRVNAAVTLYQSGAVKNLLFSGGAAHSSDVEAEVMASASIERGVPDEHIFREGRALTTWQNVRFAKKILRAHDFHTVVFISTADHLPRARRIAEYYGFEDSTTGYRACDAGM